MTSASIGTMTSKGTRRRTIRIDDELWAQAQAYGEKVGRSVSDLIREALNNYTWEPKSDQDGSKQ